MDIYTAVVAIFILASNDTRLIFSKQAFRDHVSCESKLTEMVEDLTEKANDEFGNNGYVLGSRCMIGVGNPA